MVEGEYVYSYTVNKSCGTLLRRVVQCATEIYSMFSFERCTSNRS